MNNSSTRSIELNKLWQAYRDGKTGVIDELLPILYDELRRLAHNRFKNERSNHLLQPTALVHEAYMRLMDDPPENFENRAHFLGIAARLMRRILVEYARSEDREKRGGKDKVFITDEIDNLPKSGRRIDLIRLDEALIQLEQINPLQAQIVERRFFGGLTIKETAQVLKISERDVNRKWNIARAWLNREINQ